MDKHYNIDGANMPTTKRRVDMTGADFYPTPEWATRALIDKEDFTGEIWECACGDGAMSNILSSKGNPVYSSDLYDRGYGAIGVDFLSAEKKSDNIVTNPPFHSAQEFLKKALKSADRKVALLLRLAWLEGGNRADEIFLKNPPSRVWVFSERVTFYANSTAVKSGGTTAYAWYVWDKEDNTGETRLGWLRGYKDRDYSSEPLFLR